MNSVERRLEITAWPNADQRVTALMLVTKTSTIDDERLTLTDEECIRILAQEYGYTVRKEEYILGGVYRLTNQEVTAVCILARVSTTHFCFIGIVGANRWCEPVAGKVNTNGKVVLGYLADTDIVLVADSVAQYYSTKN